MAKDRITIMIEGKHLRELDRMAKALKRSRSEMVGMALEAFMEDQRIGLEAFTNPLVSEALMKTFGNREVMRSLVKAMGDEMSDAKLQQMESLFSKMEERARKKGGK